MKDLDHSPTPSFSAVPVVGPVEPWPPGPSQGPGGRSGPPDLVRSPGTATVPCDRCEGGSRPPVNGEQCSVCAGRDEVVLAWRVSGYDRQAHAFVVSADEASDVVSAPQPCRHSVPADKVTDDVGDARKCPACLITVGVALQDQVEASATAGMAHTRAGLLDLPDGRDLFGPFASGSCARPRP